MAERVHAMPHQLSGGQQQWLARAIGPSGLLLDEPLSALDVAPRVKMRDEILRVQRQTGIATLLVTNDQEVRLLLAEAAEPGERLVPMAAVLRQSLSVAGKAD